MALPSLSDVRMMICKFKVGVIIICLRKAATVRQNMPVPRLYRYGSGYTCHAIYPACLRWPLCSYLLLPADYCASHVCSGPTMQLRCLLAYRIVSLCPHARGALSWYASTLSAFSHFVAVLLPPTRSATVGPFHDYQRTNRKLHCNFVIHNSVTS